MKKYKSEICAVAAACLLGLAAFSVYHIYDHYAQLDEQTEVFEEIAEIVEQAPDDEPVPEDVPVSEGEDVLARYQELYLQNEDMVGWISIDGTTINYPVMQTKDNPNYYLKRNFEKEYSDLGTPYIQEDCDLLTSDNLIIYGHHISGNRMFGRWKITSPRAFTKNTRRSILTPSHSRANMKSWRYLRPWRTAPRASVTMILSVRKVRKNLTLMWKHAGSLPFTIRA